MLQLEDVSFSYSESTDKVLDGTAQCLPETCRVAVEGLNGEGKSTLLKLIAGELAPTSGKITPTPGLSIAYLDQKHVKDMQQQSLTPLDYLGAYFSNFKEYDMLELLEKFGVSNDQAMLSLSSLSLGQCMRVAFARISAEEPHLLVLDEPTNHLDIYSIDALADALKSFPGGVIFASHNQYIIEEVATETWTISEGKITVQKKDFQSDVVFTQKRDRGWREVEPE